MGFVFRGQTFKSARPLPAAPPKAKWPLYKTFWAVTVFCTCAWAAIIGALLLVF